jgi:hypothetical protein
MHEFYPIAGGILLGGALSNIRLHAAWRVMLTLAVAAGATLGSGEFRRGWGYWILDLAEVTLVSASVVLLAGVWHRQRRLRG